MCDMSHITCVGGLVINKYIYMFFCHKFFFAYFSNLRKTLFYQNSPFLSCFRVKMEGTTHTKQRDISTYRLIRPTGHSVNIILLVSGFTSDWSTRSYRLPKQKLICPYPFGYLCYFFIVKNVSLSHDNGI